MTRDREAANARQRRHSRTAKWRATHRAAQARYARRNPDKIRAHKRVWYAVRTGKLVRPSSCERCGATHDRIEASHDDYSQPLAVEWLCRPCHMRKDGLSHG